MNNKIIRNRNRNKIKTDIVFKNGLLDNNLISNKTVSNSKLDLFSKKRMDVRSKSSKLEIKNKSYYKYNNKVDNYFKKTQKRNNINKRNDELQNLISLDSFDQNNVLNPQKLITNQNQRKIHFNKNRNTIKVNMIKIFSQSVEENDNIIKDNKINYTENSNEYFNIMNNNSNKTYIKKIINNNKLKSNSNKNNIIIYKKEKSNSEKASFKTAKKYKIKDLINVKNNEIDNKPEYKNTFEKIQIKVTKLLDLYSRIVSKNINGNIYLDKK